MTLFDIATTIPGILAIALIGPALIGLIIARISTALENRHRYYVEPTRPSIPKGKNVIEISTIEAMAHIKNHPAMRFVAKN
ncbi:MAG: hypothetical protein AAFO74_13050 [Pseudomonadota bacterium]